MSHWERSICAANRVRGTANDRPEGRLVNPFMLFERALQKGLDAVEEFSSVAAPKNFSKIYKGDATSRPVYRGGLRDVPTLPSYPPVPSRYLKKAGAKRCLEAVNDAPLCRD